MTLAERLAQARAELVAAGIDTTDAAADVDVYARAVLGWDRAHLLSRQREPAPDALEPAFSQCLARRATHEPTAYIVGHREFWNLSFEVTPDVLVPRPETELVVEEALGRIRGLGQARVADIGTGSGCIAVSVAHDAPACTVVATDISNAALEVARRNAAAHGVAGRVTFMRTAYLDDVPGRFDLVLANPPYIRESDKASLPLGVRREPHTALFGGMDGLRDISGVLDAAVRALRGGGWCVMEFGHDQESEVRRLAAERRELRLERIRHDLQGHPRVAVLTRQALESPDG